METTIYDLGLGFGTPSSTLLKLNIRKKGTLIMHGLLGSLGGYSKLGCRVSGLGFRGVGSRV